MYKKKLQMEDLLQYILFKIKKISNYLQQRLFKRKHFKKKIMEKKV